MTTPEPHEPPPTSVPPPAEVPVSATDREAPQDLEATRPIVVDPLPPPPLAPEPVPIVAPAPDAVVPVIAPRAQPETVYVPLAVSIGDGFKFGCGFFIALVMAVLIGFVLLALLFVLSSLIGLSLPITR